MQNAPRKVETGSVSREADDGDTRPALGKGIGKRRSKLVFGGGKGKGRDFEGNIPD